VSAARFLSFHQFSDVSSPNPIKRHVGTSFLFILSGARRGKSQSPAHNERTLLSCCFWYIWKPQLTVTSDDAILVRLNQIIRYALAIELFGRVTNADLFVTYSFSLFSNERAVKNLCVWFGRPQITINLISMKQDNTTNTQSHLTDRFSAGGVCVIICAASI
jgi:hypothetical protein